MRRTITLMLKILLFTLAFAYGVYVFMPWRGVGKLALSFGHDMLQRRGMRLNYADISGEDGGFTVSSLKISGMVDVTLGSVTIKPDMTASILSLSPVCGITFKDCNIRLGQTMNFGSGGFLLTYGREVILEGLHTDGDFSLDGYMTVNTATMKIGRADALLEVPPEFSQNMSIVSSFLPLVQEGGKWYLRRK